MNDRNAEAEISTAKDVKPLDEALRILWHRIRTATELIASLRGECDQLRQKVREMENERTDIASELARKDEEIKRLRAVQAQTRGNGGTSGFTPEEKEILKSRIRDLIAKINSHLQ